MRWAITQRFDRKFPEELGPLDAQSAELRRTRAWQRASRRGEA